VTARDEVLETCRGLASKSVDGSFTVEQVVLLLQRRVANTRNPQFGLM
jgi:hypothetical protein